MRTSSYVTPKVNIATAQTELDMRIVPYERTNGRELNDLINASIEHSQKYVQTDLPNVLVVTEKQFASLNNFTEEMMHVTDRLFRSLDSEGKVQCVMEVWIDREVDTVKEIDETIEESEAQLEHTKGFKNLSSDSTILTPDNFKNQF